jgi:hypothetical protein
MAKGWDPLQSSLAMASENATSLAQNALLMSELSRSAIDVIE